MESELILLGTLTKMSGYKGDFLMKASFTVTEDTEIPEQVFLLIEGIPVPFFISEWSIRGRDSIVLNFDNDIPDIDIREFIGCQVMCNKEDLPVNAHEQPSLENLIGYSVHDSEKGNIGTVTDILYYGENTLFNIDNAGHEIMLPVHEDLITGVDPEKRIILVVVPEGLLEL